jgi:hypothetical protein
MTTNLGNPHQPGTVVHRAWREKIHTSLPKALNFVMFPRITEDMGPKKLKPRLAQNAY